MSAAIAPRRLVGSFLIPYASIAPSSPQIAPEAPTEAGAEEELRQREARFPPAADRRKSRAACASPYMAAQGGTSRPRPSSEVARCNGPACRKQEVSSRCTCAGPSVTCERKPAREASSSAWHAGCERREERREEMRVERREEACEEEERQLARSVGHTVWPRCRASSLKEGGGLSMSLREGEEEEGKTME
ncbi:MAG: hypothetical protein SGPRY_004565 [Prymnesium sp.]